MISADKLTIRINKFNRTLFFHLVYWYLALLFYTFITGEQQIFKVHFNLLEIKNIYVVLLFLTIAISLLFSFIDFIFNDRVMRFFPIRLMIFLRSVLYLASAFILILIAARSPLTIYTEWNYKEILKLLPDMDIYFIRFLGFFYVAGFFNNFIRGTIKKVGKGNIRNWLLGMMNKPREEERIFMFLDMKSSTTIAEKLEHKKFSHLVQDIFNDLAVVDNYGGEIYQYLGDGAIISWNLKKGLKHNNFMHAFYAFTHTINRRSRYYNRKYNLIPKFKAGAHVGKVMVLQVGQIRRDISYNGDTINTAARIESMCNEYKQNFLISGDLYQIIKAPKEFNCKEVGDIKLKGKRKSTSLYQVKQIR
ncbi:MAG: adenylate/guanylate cyclase domain-containing protein [Bacteroidetes bacterium]|nr:adenylate/guanylate cyclase domain-containing protein [Bacteroidota bacterium]